MTDGKPYGGGRPSGRAKVLAAVLTLVLAAAVISSGALVFAKAGDKPSTPAECQYGPPGHQYGGPPGHQYGGPPGHQDGGRPGHPYGGPPRRQYGGPAGQQPPLWPRALVMSA